MKKFADFHQVIKEGKVKVPTNFQEYIRNNQALQKKIQGQQRAANTPHFKKKLSVPENLFQRGKNA